jgi:hypothetical protein
MPETDALDAVVDAMRHGRSVRDLASDQVVRVLQPAVETPMQMRATMRNHFFSLRMIMADRVSRHDDSAVLCFSTDNMDKPLLITLGSRKGRIFLARAMPSPAENAPQ